jgi:hypothetical protein
VSYAETHSRALNLVTRKGAVVTFTRRTTTHTEATDALTNTSSTIAGTAVQAKEDPKRYERLSLTMSGKRTLFFTPSTYGDTLKPGDTATWGSVNVTVEGVENVAPDGTVIGSYVIVGP